MGLTFKDIDFSKEKEMLKKSWVGLLAVILMGWTLLIVNLIEFNGCKLTDVDVDFNHSTFDMGEFYGCEFVNVDLNHSSMKKMYIGDSEFFVVDMRHCQLDDSVLKSVYFGNANLDGVNMTLGGLKMTITADLFCDKTTWLRYRHQHENQVIEIKELELHDLSFDGWDFSNCIFVNSHFTNCFFLGCNFAHSKIENCDFISGSYVRSSFAEAIIDSTLIKDPDMRYCSFFNAVMTKVDMVDVDLSYSTLTNLLIENSCLVGIQLYRADVGGMCIQDTTIDSKQEK